MEDKMLEQAAEILGITITEAWKNRMYVAEADAWYFWSSVRGGKQLIIGNDGTTLVADGNVNRNVMVKQFIRQSHHWYDNLS